MLKELRLTNIVLVENASISFGLGFNVLSGESGSGKSAIMNALHLIAGERCDSGILRHGANKGVVEAIFDISGVPQLIDILSDAGIDHDPDAELFIRREIATTGKSRAFINNQLTQTPLLRRVTEHLFDIVGQHANQKLLSVEYHRQALDAFGCLHGHINAFETSWKQELETRKSLEALTQSEAKRIRDIEVYHTEIKEIEEARLQEGEEEEVFAEYSQLMNAEEIAQKLGEITRLLNSEKSAFLNQLSRQKANFEQLIRLAPTLQEAATSYDNALIELHEVAHTLNAFENRIEYHPQRADQLNERLSLIARLKRKYGSTIAEIHTYLANIKRQLDILENIDVAIEQLQIELKAQSEKTDTLAKALTTHRQRAAKQLKPAIESQLRTLNMPKVEFDIEVSPQKRGNLGDDKIEFFMVPNVGEHRISICECASGGELSRTMLALQAVLAGKELIPTLIFDEIDSNIGGETANIVGEKMGLIGKQHQVLCITHFPQVAQHAEHHLRISKQEIDGRTLTIVDSLNKITRQKELQRMQGMSSKQGWSAT